MKNVINRVCNWNKARYDQKHNTDLTFRLLDEELNEFVGASMEKDTVEQVDALVDIIYVAIGALWKLGLNEDQIQRSIVAVCDSNDSKTAVKTIPTEKANIDKGKTFIPPTEALTQIVKEMNDDY